MHGVSAYPGALIKKLQQSNAETTSLTKCEELRNHEHTSILPPCIMVFLEEVVIRKLIRTSKTMYPDRY
jgi:hypothetical protein